MPGGASPFNNFYPGGANLSQAQMIQQRQAVYQHQQQFLLQQMAAAAASAGHNMPPEFAGNLHSGFSFGPENQAHAQEAAAY